MLNITLLIKLYGQLIIYSHKVNYDRDFLTFAKFLRINKFRYSFHLISFGFFKI